MNILSELKSRFLPALTELADDPSELLEMIRPAQDAKFGDYQANCAMPLGKKIGKPPRQAAAMILEKTELGDFCHEPEIAGPGFINLRIKDDWIVARASQAIDDPRMGVAATTNPRTYVIDFSAPNVAKPMHVGHIRSTVIGDALCRTLRFLGHKVVSDNHIGDWGTQFGMVIYGYKHFRDAAAYAESPVAELGRLYKFVNQIMDYHKGKEKLPRLQQHIFEMENEVEAHSAAEIGDKAADKKAAKALRRLKAQCADARSQLQALKEKLDATDSDPRLSELAAEHLEISQAVLNETAKLHAGDAENKALWEEFLPYCHQDIQKIYDRIDVSFDYEYGESFYHDQLAGVVEDFLERGLAKESEGAICVFLDGFDAPMIIRKKDGAFLYATTDLATIAYRMKTWNPDAILYVVDHRQGEHFTKLFAAARKWDCPDVELQHISFGTVLGEDGRPYKTRSGVTVGLKNLLDEAVEKAHGVVSENDDAKPSGPQLSEQERKHIAHVVGHAAIKYADLSQNRTSDYVFSYDKMMALQGNTATYMQYSYARVQSILARGKVDIEQLRTSNNRLTISHPAERALALAILRFSEALEETIVDYRPNLLTSYLFELAKRYSSFFDQCPVLKAESDELRTSRLLLCDLTGRMIKQGLALLGIHVVDKM